MRPSVRLLGIVLLGSVLVGMGVHYETTDERHWPYPDGEQLAAEYTSHVGDQTFLFGTVQSVDRANETVDIVVQAGGGLPLTVSNVDKPVQPGGVLQVYGTVRPGNHIEADGTVVVNPAGSSLAFKYGISLVGALLVTVLFFRQWRVDTDDLGFEVR